VRIAQLPRELAQNIWLVAVQQQETILFIREMAGVLTFLPLREHSQRKGHAEFSAGGSVRDAIFSPTDCFADLAGSG
jgi:hypothetical protein